MLKNSINLAPARQELYRAKLVFYLFLASLGMFFIASLITYLIIRERAFHGMPDAIPGSPMAAGPDRYVALKIPISFWVSTAALLVISFSLQKSVWAVRAQHLDKFRNWLKWSLMSAVIFVAIQCFGMYGLWLTHFSAVDGSTKVYGMSFTLAFIHALHVLGGMIFLGYVIHQAKKDRYDHECHWAVDHCASYWHFLDVVWACMLIMFFVTG